MNGGNSLSRGGLRDGPAGPGHGSGEPAWEADLSPADRAAIEALIDSGWEASSVAGPHRGRASHLAALLAATVGAPVAGRDETLEDVVLLRVARLRASGVAAEVPATGELSAADAAALDALVAAGMNPGSLAPEHAPRGTRQITLLSMLDASDLALEAVEDREDRIGRTLAAVQRSIDADEGRFVLPEVAPRGRRLHFADIISIAALLLIAAGVMLPIASGVREYGRRASCQSGMLAAGLGFGQYAAANRDLLPMASPSRGGHPWWEVGVPERSNSANLFTLVRTGHTKLSELACPGNPSACRTSDGAGAMDWRRFPDVSYSYRNLFGRSGVTIEAKPSAVLISDRSTLSVGAPGVLHIRPFDNSPNHGGRGQFALVADGSVRWLSSPILGDGDNLWLPKSLEDALARLRGEDPTPPRADHDLTGTEIPATPADEFVAP